MPPASGHGPAVAYTAGFELMLEPVQPDLIAQSLPQEVLVTAGGQAAL